MQDARANRKLHILWVVAHLLVVVSGCRRQANTDVYVQNMASEIRALEDRVWEYDGEFRSLEHELLALQEENRRLRATSAGSNKTSPTRILGTPQFAEPLAPSVIEPTSPYILKVPSARNDSAGSSSQSDRNDEKRSTGPDARSASIARDGLLSKQHSLLARPEANTEMPNDSNRLDSATPETQPSSAGRRSAKPPRARGGSQLPGSLKREDLELNFAPPMLDKSQSSSQNDSQPIGLPDANDPQVVQLGQIKVPGLSQVQPAAAQDIVLEVPSDARIIEIAFHPSLCRGTNSDEDASDDGIYLVLQPRNASGEFLAEPANLTVAVYDTSRREEDARVGLWKFSKQEVGRRIQPVGVSQGIHLPLIWQNGDPIGDRVIVTIAYETDNGKRLVNERSIDISHDSIGQSAWLPMTGRGGATGATPVTRPTSQLR